MKEHFVQLTDGTRLEVKINFGTMYYLQKCGANSLAKKIEKMQKKKRQPSERDMMEFAAKVIYAVLRSNGKTVTFDEAMSLMPTDLEEMQEMVYAYQEELEKVKKKQDSKEKMKKMGQR